VVRRRLMKRRYGKTEYNSETAVNVFIDILEDQSGKEYTSKLSQGLEKQGYSGAAVRSGCETHANSRILDVC